MKNIHKVLLLLTSMIITLFIFISCEKELITESNKENGTENLLEKKDPPPYYITPFIQEETHYETHHFVTKTGRIFGIWPASYDVARLTEIRNKFGFTDITAGLNPQYSAVTQAGFNTNQVMQLLNGNNYTQAYTGVAAYYIDEPYNENYSLNLWSNISSFLHTNFPQKPFVSGEYSICQEVENFFQYNDIVMYTAYEDNWQLPFCLVAGINDDQRPSWELMNETFGTKFSMCWINSWDDADEFDNLLGKATNMNLDAVWLYTAGLDGDFEDMTDYTLEKYCNAAWRKGWIRKFAEKVIYRYLCYEQSLEDCDGDPEHGIPTHWVLDEIIHTGIIVERFYDLWT